MLLFLLPTLAFATNDSLQERVSSALLSAVSAQFTDQETQLEILHLGLNPASRCGSSAKVHIQFGKREDFQGSINAVAEAFDQSGRCGRWRFRPKVAIWTKLPVATKSVQAGEQVSIGFAKHRYDSLQGSFLRDTSQPWVARRRIAAGQPLTVDMLRPKPTNLEGDQVVLIVKNGSITIKTRGRLMSDAMIGEKVRVFTAATSNVIEGTLTHKGRVLLGGTQ